MMEEKDLGDQPCATSEESAFPIVPTTPRKPKRLAALNAQAAEFSYSNLQIEPDLERDWHPRYTQARPAAETASEELQEELLLQSQVIRSWVQRIKRLEEYVHENHSLLDRQATVLDEAATDLETAKEEISRREQIISQQSMWLEKAAIENSSAAQLTREAIATKDGTIEEQKALLEKAVADSQISAAQTAAIVMSRDVMIEHQKGLLEQAATDSQSYAAQRAEFLLSKDRIMKQKTISLEEAAAASAVAAQISRDMILSKDQIIQRLMEQQSLLLGGANGRSSAKRHTSSPLAAAFSSCAEYVQPSIPLLSAAQKDGKIIQSQQSIIEAQSLLINQQSLALQAALRARPLDLSLD